MREACLANRIWGRWRDDEPRVLIAMKEGAFDENIYCGLICKR